MKKVFISCLLFAASFVAKAQYGSFDSAKTVPTFKVFDNVYYVGIDMVSAYLVPTSKGLILIDALYGKYSAHIPEAVRQLGYDPKNIRYIICTHAHFDHFEGADTLQRLYGSRVGMTEIDWQIAEGKIKTGYESLTAHVTRDLVIHDGDSLTLGGTTLKFYVTPGHTPGVLSIAFPVKDGNKTYKAFMFGGVGLNFEGVQQTESYINSVKRLMRMNGVQVNLSNHPQPGKIFERHALLLQRKPGEPNPYVDPADYQRWLKDLLEKAEEKLAEEKKKAGRN